MWRVRTNFETGFSMIDSEFCMLSSGEVLGWVVALQSLQIWWKRFHQLDVKIQHLKFCGFLKKRFSNVSSKLFYQKLAQKKYFWQKFHSKSPKMTRIAYRRFSKLSLICSSSKFRFLKIRSKKHKHHKMLRKK